MKQHRLMWAEEWTTSIAWLDDEHRDLVDYYHAVLDALREDEVDVFLARLRELREWLGRHFQNEEAALDASAAETPIDTGKTIKCLSTRS
jgi:hemerythrin